jgi:Flp pilus assembly protein TadG
MRGYGFLRGRRRGDAVLEFALLTPLLILILFGILELGRVVDAWIVVHNAAREGARAGVLMHSDAAAESAARVATDAYLTAGLSSVRGDILSKGATAVGVSSTSVDVTAEAEVDIFSPLFESILGSSAAHVRASASMRRQ